MKLLKSKAGFTMVELLVVVIIVGILAAVSIPLYQANIKRAIRTEAETTLGAIRSAERIYKSEFNAYLNMTTAQVNNVLGVNVAESHFFDASCYDVSTGDSVNFTANCKSQNGNAAAAAAQAKKYFGTAGEIVSSINAAGVITP